MTNGEQSAGQGSAEEQEQLITASGDGSAPKEKKSVLKKVKDKVKRLGSKLKSPGKGHDSGETTEKPEDLVDQNPVGDEDEEEGEELAEIEPSDTPQSAGSESRSKDLDVPLDEYALIKQKESEKKDDEASAKGGLGDNLTEGISSQAIAEQDPPDALQAVPTEYHYKEDEEKAKDETPVSGSAAAEDEKVSRELKDEPAAGSVEKASSEQKDKSVSDSVAEPREEPVSSEPKEDEKVSSEPKGVSGEPEKSTGVETQDRSWPEEDLSLKTHGHAEAPDEKPETPAASPQVPHDETSEPKDGPKFSDKDIQALSSSNLYTGEPDVKATSEDHEKEGNDEGGGDVVASGKPREEQEELKENVPSADSKLEEETSGNADPDESKVSKAGFGITAADTRDEKKESLADTPDEKKAESDQVRDRSVDDAEDFADAKPVIEPTEDAPELSGNDSGAAEVDTGAPEGKPAGEKNQARDRSVDDAEEFADAKPVIEPTTELSGNDSGAAEVDTGAPEGKPAGEKKELPEESEVFGKESAKETTPFESSSTQPKEEHNRELSEKTPEKEFDGVSTETQAPSDSGEALEKTLGGESAADQKSAAEINEEKSTKGSDEVVPQKIDDQAEPQLGKSDDQGKPKLESEGAKEKTSSEAAPKCVDSEATQGSFLQNIASKFGYASPNASEKEKKNVEEEQKRFIDSKA